MSVQATGGNAGDGPPRAERRADVFGEVAFVLEELWDVRTFRSAWVCRCRACSAGWMIQRPPAGVHPSRAEVLSILNHSLEHLAGRWPGGRA